MNDSKFSNFGEMLDLSQLQINSDDMPFKKTVSYESLITPEIYHMIMNGTREQQIKGTKMVHKLLTITNMHPVQDILNSDGLLNKIVEFLDVWGDQSLQLEAIMVMINFTGWEAQPVIDAGALPRLIRLIESKNRDLQETAIWAIGNIASESSTVRNLIFSLNVLDPLLNILYENNFTEKPIKYANSCLSNLCLDKMNVSIENLSKILPVLSPLLKTQTDTDELIDICKTISYLSDGPNERIQAVIDSIDLRPLIKLLNKDKLTQHVLQLFGKITNGNVQQKEVLFQLGMIDYLRKLIDNPDESIKAEVYSILSNLTAGNTSQIQAVIDSGVIQKAISMYLNEGFRMKGEIVWILGNIIEKGSRPQISYIVEHGAIEILLYQMEDNKLNYYKKIFDWFQDLINLIDPEIEDIITIKCALFKLNEKVQYT